MLEREGLVVSEVNKGFRVAALSEARVRELYPILGALEGLAVRESGEQLRARIGELRAANAALRASRTGRQRHALDVLGGDPLASLASLEAIDGVMVRGIWLPRGDLDRALDTLEQLAARGYILRDHFLGWLRYRLAAAHLPVGRPLFAGIAPLAPYDDRSQSQLEA